MPADFYGRDYWFGHMRELGHPDIRERARRDLSERCLHWLRTVLRYCRPPARTLELGCGHGGFVAMLRSAGFDARGLELSPSIAGFATRTFGVPVLTGPVEDQAIGPGSMDLVLAMDVLEHFSDPLETVRHCAGLLEQQGLFLFQTPCYPEGMAFDDMQAHRSPFLEQLRPQEHIYLFSRTSVRALFERVGFGHVVFGARHVSGAVRHVRRGEPGPALDTTAGGRSGRYARSRRYDGTAPRARVAGSGS